MRKYRKFNILHLIIVGSFLAVSAAANALPAFPGAEGFGSNTPGGRGGTVIEVTNLNNSGSGSFRAACEASGPRIVVFRTGGTIVLSSDIWINNPYITIAAQTAPGDGVSIRGAGLRIATHDVIVRGLRIRVGDGSGGPNPDNRDGLGIENKNNPPYNIIIDHCSLSWAVDETGTMWYASHDITFQWNILSEALMDSIHSKGGHSMGLLAGPGSKKITLHHNLLAHNQDRNPLFGGTNSQSPTMGAATQAELINNVIYNWGWFATRIATNLSTTSPQKVNIVGNYYKKGADTDSNKGIFVRDSDVLAATRVYVKDNIGPGRPTGNENEWSIVEGSESNRSNSPTFTPSGVNESSAFEAYDDVLDNVGAIAPNRDSVDARVVKSVRNGTGRIIDSQSEVGGWPSLKSGTAPQDSDHDGMPDNWETSHGLNPNNASDGNTDRNGDGYTNVEEYINSLIPMGSGVIAPSAPSPPRNLRIIATE